MKGSARVLKHRRGQSLVEFALVAPIMLILLLGLIDFGRAYYSGVILTGAAREGARYAAVNRCATTTSCNTVNTNVRNRVLDAIGQNAPLPVASTECLADPPANPDRPCIAIASFDTGGTSSTFRDEGYGIRVRVYGEVVLYTSFLAEGVGTLAPGIGLCYGTAPNRVCRIPVQGEAFMVIL